ncbi:cation diffusion facilitator family transporter [Mycetocola reblochoni]|uniref:Cation diffusion facilitator family transporter n=2 Tax=Mycetocola reblochoni TaxID=331618 RepID=A0A3L6ZQK9_9MICO|nr:cation diffusion facilitator family transporter [Mycetocola reblochoni]RLP70137.1 cation diffusion facilitator family transporter [Mycetocola reblochoni]SJN20490.1 putative membrane transport protein [Mycetocola reblochoni REB411]
MRGTREETAGPPGRPGAASGHTERRRSGGTTTVVVAFAANVAVAIAKSFVAALTGSASLVAEAAHSWADAGNEVFLLVAERKGSRRRDARHPLGYGRESYVWSMFAAIGVFTAGSVVSIMHGISQLGAAETDVDYTAGYIVLGIAALLEGTSFVQALAQARGQGRARGLHPLRLIARTSNPTLRAVFIEDGSALLGLLIAAGAMLAHELTGQAVFDAVGSIVIGVLLAVVALFLISRNRDFLVGQSPSIRERQRLLDMLRRQDEVERVTYLHVEYVGPERVFLVAAIDIRGNEVESSVALSLRGLERRLELSPLIEEAVLTLATPGEESLVRVRPLDVTDR